jgi:DNA-binding LytR/AlgR family response regulator
MQTKMNCIIIDDEPLARKGLEKFVAEVPYLQLVASCSNALQAVELINTREIQLVLLDIEMPRVTGLDLIRTVQQMPLTIITTAFPDYAVMSYELNVMDYLVKPVSFSRFLKAVNKARDYYELSRHNAQEPAADYFFIKCEGRYEKVLYAEVCYIEALQNYVVVQLEGRRLISHLTMKAMEESLPPELFIKISKSYIVPFSRIDRIEGYEVVIGKQHFPIGRVNRDEILQRIFNGKLIKRNG